MVSEVFKLPEEGAEVFVVGYGKNKIVSTAKFKMIPAEKCIEKYGKNDFVYEDVRSFYCIPHETSSAIIEVGDFGGNFFIFLLCFMLN